MIQFFYINSRLNFHSVAYEIHIDLRVGVQLHMSVLCIIYIYIVHILYVEDFNVLQ